MHKIKKNNTPFTATFTASTLLHSQSLHAAIIFIIIFLNTAAVKASTQHPEKWYQIVWCLANKGEMEAKMRDNSRVDCLTNEYAVEVEFASKWPEALGQSLHYALLSKRKPGIALIIKTAKDLRHWHALRLAVKSYNLPINLWKIDARLYSY